ncbi:hypothetical protein SCLCIDRAFT_1206792 [Scleroderma citrinum Foug A]|uniref:Uncharacterized protein n=1 Tax=Scleroderma citrinum Foug A TaxID=1036808 RepID=A0A0C3AA90_9AGAM|nr:hypothetical protein SCLCIDRAFT_1206792 [Scleroderma citrinum Foug A]
MVVFILYYHCGGTSSSNIDSPRHCQFWGLPVSIFERKNCGPPFVMVYVSPRSQSQDSRCPWPRKTTVQRCGIFTMTSDNIDAGSAATGKR